jgi:hypothetical protein
VLAQASRKVEVWWSKSREEPGAHKQRHPVKQRQISTFGETGSTQFFEQGCGPALFLEESPAARRQAACYGIPINRDSRSMFR